MMESKKHQLDDAGYCLMQGVFSAEECASLAAAMQQTLTASDSPAVQKRGDAIYGARDLLRLFPPAAGCWRREPLLSLLQLMLGDAFGLVRGLYFDKPPGAGWSLPWHRDLTIAVENNKLPSTAFTHPTRKAGVPHVETPRELLQRMLTLRIHLDDVTDANGPLRIAPGSHRLVDESSASDDREVDSPVEIIYASAGDVLAMRPLLMHSSAGVDETQGSPTPRHRRVIHLEFASDENLPDGYAWRDFAPSRVGAIAQER